VLTTFVSQHVFDGARREGLRTKHVGCVEGRFAGIDEGMAKLLSYLAGSWSLECLTQPIDLLVNALKISRWIINETASTV
jgi:hypothetical protein